MLHFYWVDIPSKPNFVHFQAFKCFSIFTAKIVLNYLLLTLQKFQHFNFLFISILSSALFKSDLNLVTVVIAHIDQMTASLSQIDPG